MVRRVALGIAIAAGLALVGATVQGQASGLAGGPRYTAGDPHSQHGAPASHEDHPSSPTAAPSMPPGMAMPPSAHGPTSLARVSAEMARNERRCRKIKKRSLRKQCLASVLPDSYRMTSLGIPYWGVPNPPHMHDHGGVSLASLRGPAGTPDRTYDLTAARGSILLGGKRRPAITVNGTTPGPILTATQGDLMQVTLRNKNVRKGVSLHWHGVDVPGGEDGVAGVTQNAVLPGQKFVYRFIVPDAGTYWYHSHQYSRQQVGLGLLGAFVVRPPTPSPNGSNTQLTEVAHTYHGRLTLNGRTGSSPLTTAPNTVTRVRFVNSDSGPLFVSSSGSFAVAAIDGTELNRPTALDKRTYVEIPAGGRADLLAKVATSRVRVGAVGGPSLLIGPGSTTPPSLDAATKEFDPLSYGTATNAAALLGAPDRRFLYKVGMRTGYLDGERGNWYTINGKSIPKAPMYMVKTGDVVRLRYANRTGSIHPLHLHGHHALVLSRNGKKSTGSPWWVDSLEVKPGQTYDLLFKADNPGVWMFHCHNLPHASQGLVTHLSYAGVRTPYKVGKITKHLTNHPE